MFSTLQQHKQVVFFYMTRTRALFSGDVIKIGVGFSSLTNKLSFLEFSGAKYSRYVWNDLLHAFIEWLCIRKHHLSTSRYAALRNSW
jgi:hypothetical protein